MYILTSPRLAGVVVTGTYLMYLCVSGVCVGMYTCMCVCVYACVSVWVWVCACVCACVYACVSVWVCTWVRVWSKFTFHACAAELPSYCICVLTVAVSVYTPVSGGPESQPLHTFHTLATCHWSFIIIHFMRVTLSHHGFDCSGLLGSSDSARIVCSGDAR